MCEQVFKKNVPISILFALLEQICLKTEKYYFLDLNAFKKLQFHDLFVKFREEIRPYYHVSKRFYIDRDFTYRMFANIVRQLSRMANVRFDSEIKYHQSKYHVDYMIYHNGDTTEQEVSAHKGHKAPKGALTKGDETKGEETKGETTVEAPKGATVEAPKSALPEVTDPSISS
jgi:hypothetical protein